MRIVFFLFIFVSNLGAAQSLTNFTYDGMRRLVMVSTYPSQQRLSCEINETHIVSPETLQQCILPLLCDLTADICFLPAFDQGSMQSCTANSLVALVEFLLNKRGQLKERLSRLFLFHNQYRDEPKMDPDYGPTLYSGLHALATYGVCYESLWPYSNNHLAYQRRPPFNTYVNASRNLDLRKITLKKVPPLLPVIKYVLAIQQQPIVFGMEIYRSFKSSRTEKSGYVQMPRITDDPYMFGHAVLAVGYDDTQQVIIFRNSWGPSWGDGGNGYLPYDYVLNRTYCNDFWTIEL